MTESSSFGTLSTPDHKRRKVETEVMLGNAKTERARVEAAKAKANYLSGQLRLRLQYAKLKVEHGWQRQSLSEVENLYFRHTHLTRPYPVISPGGRRNGRTLSSNSLTAGPQQENVSSSTASSREQSFTGSIVQLSSSSSQRSDGTLLGASSYSSNESSLNLSIPFTPIPDTTRIATPFAPHVGFGSVTRYPISRSDSSQTLIAETTPSLYQGSPTKPYTSSAPYSHASASASSTPSQQIAQSQPRDAFRDPFDPMEPTDHLDSQLAALRSIITASSLPIPLPPPSPTTPMPLGPVSSNTIAGGTTSGLTYDAFWNAHGSASASFHSLLASQGAQPSRSTSGTPLQPSM